MVGLETNHDFSLNELIEALCIALGYSDDYCGEIRLMFGQGGLRQPVFSDAENKMKLVPLLEKICTPLFLSRPIKGFVFLNIHEGKLSGVPRCDDKGLDSPARAAYIQHELECERMWGPLKKNPEVPINSILINPRYFSRRSAHSYSNTSGKMAVVYKSHR